MSTARAVAAPVRTRVPAAAFTLGAAAAFAAAVAGVHAARPDLQALATPLSFYLHGRGGVVLQAAYVLLALALVVQSLACYADVPAGKRSAAPPVLFGLAATGLVVTAFATMNPPAGTPTFEGWLHGVGAMTAFLCTTTGALMQAARLRGHWSAPSWRPVAVAAVAAFVALWVHVLVRAWPRGLTQKTVVALVLVWLVATALGLLQRRRD